MIDPALYETWERVLPQFVATPGFRLFWEQEKGMFSDAFRRVVDQMLAA
jgi:hypothetical protein